MKPSDALVEEVAKALWESVNAHHGWSLPWAEMHGSDHALYRNQARAVLRSPSIQALVEAARELDEEFLAGNGERLPAPRFFARLARAREPFEAVPEEAAK